MAEQIIPYLRRRLKESGAATWADIARETETAPSLLRKIAYGDRQNVGVHKIQRLWDYFQQEDARRSRSRRKEAVNA